MPLKKSDVIAHFETVTAVAEALGISIQAVSKWPEDVPELRALQLERITDGELKAYGKGESK